MKALLVNGSPRARAVADDQLRPLMVERNGIVVWSGRVSGF